MKNSAAALSAAVLVVLFDVCCSLRCYGCHWAINSSPEYGSDFKCKSDQLVAEEPDIVKECYGENQKCYVKTRSDSKGTVRVYYRGCESASQCEKNPTVLTCCDNELCNGDPAKFPLSVLDARRSEDNRDNGCPLMQSHVITLTTGVVTALGVMIVGRG